MPELPDITVYIDALDAHVGGKPIERVRIQSPFLVRSVDPPVSAVEGLRVLGFRRMGKRIVWEFEGGLFLVLHLMIAGRLRWKGRGVKIPRKLGLAAFDFEAGSVLLTEAGTKKRASLHAVRGEEGLEAFDRGGLEVLTTDVETFREQLVSENHTLKRSLTDPRLFSGIGNAYSDEILHRAGLSPLKLTSRMDDEEIRQLFRAVRDVLQEWVERLHREVGGGFPDKVTAFHAEMAVHGKFREPCPVCAAPVQRIAYASNECNYCPGCQTGGKILKDRSLSRLLKGDWPKTLEELERG